MLLIKVGQFLFTKNHKSRVNLLRYRRHVKIAQTPPPPLSLSNCEANIISLDLCRHVHADLYTPHPEDALTHEEARNPLHRGIRGRK